MSLFTLSPTITVNDAGLCGGTLSVETIAKARDLRVSAIVEHAIASLGEAAPPPLKDKLNVLSDQIKQGIVAAERESTRLEIEEELRNAQLDQTVRSLLAAPADFSDMQMIIPGLYISSQFPAMDRILLQSAGITHICMCMEFPPPFPTRFRYLVLKVHDTYSQEIKSRFDESYLFISKARRRLPHAKVLVHCAAGISRSSTVAIAYLMREFGLSAGEGLAMVRAARPYVSPNEGFAKQLLEYEMELQTARGNVATDKS